MAGLWSVVLRGIWRGVGTRSEMVEERIDCVFIAVFMSNVLFMFLGWSSVEYRFNSDA